jgi:hypothetical protein
MKAYRAPGWLLVLAIAAFGWACSAQPPPANDGKSGKLTAEEIGKQWGFGPPVAFKENGTYADGSESNGDKLKLGLITIKMEGRSYSETYARVVKFYTKKIGYDYDYDPKKVVTKKGGDDKGQFIFFDVRGTEPRESSFVYNTAAYTVSGLIRPAPEKDTVEVTLTIAAR